MVFGSTRIVEPAAARRRLEEARTQLAESPDDRRLTAGRGRGRAVCCERSHYYEAAREFARLVSSRPGRTAVATT